MTDTTQEGMNQKIYQALYNPMTEESAYATLSIHRTKEGAQKAIDYHKAQKLIDHNNRYPNLAFGEFEDWCVNEIELKD